ncbi:hypothetical protein LSAJ156_470017 [Latilactobacillus sakei]|nr:hypothetical protein LSAJ160_290006 [Latilactobacillus sakei]SOB40814.1 hypothetical protein LSAJ156_470017 [Latilactobacillus sakei]SON70192.1 protein of unknown function [Latilactobacillus sakei]
MLTIHVLSYTMKLVDVVENLIEEQYENKYNDDIKAFIST